MKISALQQNNYNIRIKPNINTNKLERTPSSDTVSFSSKHERKKKLSPNVEKALEFGQKVINKTAEEIFSWQNLEAIVQEYVPNVAVLPLEALEGEIPNAQDYGAYFQCTFSENFMPTAKRIYIDLPPENLDEMANLIYAMRASHEFTHLQQMNSLESCELLKNLSRGNYDYAKLIVGIRDTIFNVFDNQIQAAAVLDVFRNDIDIAQLKKYDAMVPREMQVSKQLLAKNLNLPSEKEMQNYLKKQYNDIFNQVISSLQANQPETLGLIPKNEDMETLRKKVRICCAMAAKKEFEAYTTESEMAKKALKTDKTINIDAFPMYYSVLEQALK